MTEKSKRKVNLRRRVLLRLLLGIGIIAALIPLVLKQFEPEHLYLVYESYDEDTLASNLYLYDATIGKTTWQITNNANKDALIFFDTAKNAHYLVYQVLIPSSSEVREGSSLILVNLKTRQERVLTDERSDSNFSLDLNGEYLAYRELKGFEPIMATHLLNLNTFEDQIIREFNYSEFDVSPFLRYEWVGSNLMIMMRSGHEAYVHSMEMYDLETGTISTVEIPLIQSVSFPIVSSNTVHLSYLQQNGSGNEAIISALDGDDAYTPNIPDTPNRGIFLESYPMAWSPNNQDLLIRVVFEYPVESRDDASDLIFDWDNYHHDVILNTLTQEIRYLSEDTRYTQLLVPEWNADGSHIVSLQADRRCTSSGECSQYVIWNIETGEESVLPLSGLAIGWVRIP